MKFRNLTLATLFEVVTSIAILVLSFAQTNSTLSSHSASRYAPYEKRVYQIALTFHEHFDTHEFEQNKPLAVDDLRVDASGANFGGTDELVKGISRGASNQ